MDKNTSEKVAKILLKIKGITLSPEKPFKYSSGILSPVYTDCRILMSHPEERTIIRDLYIEAIRDTSGEVDVIAGTATAGIPHAAWIAEKMKLPMIYIRGKAKDHGKGNQIEGTIGKDQKAVVIEDLISTGESSLGSIQAIKAAGGKADHIYSIITYSMKKSEDNFKSNKILLTSLTNFETVVNVALENNSIKKEDQNVILEWAKDPASWGKRMGFE